MRIRLQHQRHVAVVPARDGRRVAAQRRHRAQQPHRLRLPRAGARRVEGVQVRGEDAGGLEGHGDGWGVLFLDGI